MDAYQRYNTNAGPPPPPPPPSMPELQHDQLQNHHPAPPPPQWYPGQNHYQPTLQPPPPPVPGLHQQYPPQPHQWGPPPAAYPNQQYLPHQYPPPHLPPPMHPPPYHHSQVPSQPYSAGHQAWENPNWTHQQGYEYQGKSNEDDWAARARAWAAAKAATDNQQKQSTFPQGMRPDLQTPFHDPYVHGAEHQHLEPTPGSYPNANLQNPYESGNYQHVSLPDGQSNNASGAYHNGLASFNSASASAGPNNHLPNDGSLADESNTTVHQLEVPSSYSSITGRDMATTQNQMQFKSFPGPSSAFQGGQQGPSMVPAIDRPDSVDRFFSSNDVSDKPLDFAPRANMSSMYPPPGSSGYIRESTVTMPVNHSWAPHLATGNIYPTTANSGSQFVPPMPAHSPISGQVAPVFGTAAGPNFPPTLPAVGGGPFSPGVGPSFVSSATFPVDPYGASSASDRPKKASVPNWLKEEIYKKKIVMATSVHEYHKEEIQSMEDETGHQSFGKDDQAESKSIDSLRSAEEEDDEDYVEAARTAAINKEIKRVLTEVLMKVTDDLFDEIATKVLNEEDTTTEVAINQSSASVLVPKKSEGADSEDDTGKTSSVLPGGLVGLLSYGTDSDEETNEIIPAEQSFNEKHENGDGDTQNLGKLDVTTSLVVTSTDLIDRTVVHEEVSGTKGNERKQKNGTVKFDVENSVREKEPSDQGRPNEASSHKLKTDLSGRESESKTNSRSPVMEGSDRTEENKEDQSQGKHGERHPNVGKSDALDGSKHRKKEGFRADEKLLRKISSPYDEEDKKEIERSRRVTVKEDYKRELVDDEKSERSKHKHSSNSNRHKKGRSPSPSSRRKKNKIGSSVSGGSSTNDDSLEDNERKSRSKRRPRSPSPVRSRKRQVSRSPERSHRRHSPYSSFESSRRKRSRSRSPGRRHR